MFGCEAYAHKSEGKLDPRAIKCVFVGYQDGTKGYRLWDITSGGVKIIISRDVKYNELTFPCKINNTEENPRPSSPSNLVIGGNTQIELEQQDPLTTSTSQSPNTHVEFPNQDETSDQDSDREALPDDPKVEKYYPLQQDLSNYQLTRD